MESDNYMEVIKETYLQIKDTVQNANLFGRKMDFSGIVVTDDIMQLIVCAYFFGLVQSQLKPTVIDDDSNV